MVGVTVLAVVVAALGQGQPETLLSATNDKGTTLSFVRHVVAVPAASQPAPATSQPAALKTREILELVLRQKDKPEQTIAWFPGSTPGFPRDCLGMAVSTGRSEEFAVLYKVGILFVLDVISIDGSGAVAVRRHVLNRMVGEAVFLRGTVTACVGFDGAALTPGFVILLTFVGQNPSGCELWRIADAEADLAYPAKTFRPRVDSLKAEAESMHEGSRFAEKLAVENGLRAALPIPPLTVSSLP